MMRRLWEIVRLFLKLGTTTFGGPAVHVAVMEHEAVEQRGWLSREQFLDLLGVTYLIPGPNSTEMACQIGYHRAGVAGCIAGGAAFALPAAIISGLLAWGYDSVRSGMPQVEPFFLGIKPIVLGIIFVAVWRLGRTALRSWQTVLIAAGVTGASIAGSDEILAFVMGSLVGTIFLRCSRPGRGGAAPQAAVGALTAATAVGSASCAQAGWPLVAAAAPVAGAATVPLWKLALFFLKVGAIMYGSGYVLIAYLEGGLVEEYGWLTQEQLVDAVAVGQITPGPLLSTVTFVGFLVAGVPGAIVATVAMLTPSFVFVSLVSPWVSRLRRSRWAGLFLDAVGAASLGLTAAVTVTLSGAALVDWPSWLIAILGGLVSWSCKVSPLWLILAGALAGRLIY